MKRLACSLLSILILLTISCEIGLGESVDTDPPSLNIDAELVDSVISGDFDIEGTYKDDGTIDTVTAVLKRTDGKGSDIKLNGTIESDPKNRGSGIWKIPVNSKSGHILDGSYQATVYIKDKVDRVTTQNTTFTIDNTPPVLILTKPNSNPGDETVSAYGQRVFLEGNIADTADKTYITVKFYADSNYTEPPLAEITTSAIAPTDVNSNNAKLTVYKDDFYDQVYRASSEYAKEGSKDVYIKIITKDIAGNETSDFYFSKDLAKNLTKSKESNDPDAYGLVAKDIYNILNGTDALLSNGRTANFETTVKDLLAQNVKQKAMFSMNPSNSPYFTVGGMKTLTKTAEQFTSADNGYWVINGAQSLEISVFMGSDSIELVDDDKNTPENERQFYVYALECDEFGNAIKENIEANRIKLYSKSKEIGTGSAKKTYYNIGGKQTHKTTSGAYVFTVPMSKTLCADPDKPDEEGYVTQNLEVGKNYIILVNGKDNEDNPIEPNETGYGFHFSTATNAPILNITSPEKNTSFYKVGSGVLFEGSAKTEAGVAEVSIWKGNEKFADVPLQSSVDGELNSFSYLIPASAFSQDESETYSFTIRATDGDAFTEKLYSIWYDVEPPEIFVNTILPVVEANDKENLNGLLNIKGTIIEDFDRLETATYKVIQDNTENEELGGVITGSSFNISIDTTKLTDKKDVEIVIEAADRVGNKNEWKKTYFVDQSTDKPVITASGLDITKGTDESVLDEKKNIFARGANLVLQVSDDDAVKKAVVKLGKKTNNTFEEPSSTTNDTTIYQTYETPSVISHTLPAEIGIYLATVLVYDENFVSEIKTPNNFKECKFILRVTGNGPEVTIKPEKEYISTKDGAGISKLTINISDEGNGPYKVYVNGEEKFTDEQAPMVYNLSYPQGTTSASEITFKVFDSNDSFTTVFYTQKFDNELPVVTNVKFIKQDPVNPTEVYSNQYGYYINNTTDKYTISGIATDDVGIGSIELVITEDDNTSNKKSGTFNNNYGQWAFTDIDLSEWVSVNDHDCVGATAKIVVKDKAGNKVEVPDINIIFDTKYPVAHHQIDDTDKDLEFRIGEGDNGEGGKFNNNTYGNALTFLIRGHYMDNGITPGIPGSGIKQFYYKVFNNQEVFIDKIKATGANPVVEGNAIYFNSPDVLKEYVMSEEHRTGIFYPITEETKSIKYNIKASNVSGNATSGYIDSRIGGTYTGNTKVEDGVTYYIFQKDIISNFKETVKGMKEGKNYLVLVAEDNVGNSSVDMAEVPTPTPEDPDKKTFYPCYPLNVDITAPSIPEKHNETVYTNVDASNTDSNIKIEITGTVSDKASVEDGSSGIKEIVFTSDVNDNAVTISVNPKDTDAQLAAKGLVRVPKSATQTDSTLMRWTVDIKSLLDKSASSAIISAKVIDNTGLETSKPVANVIMDIDGPTIVINSPVEDSKNGTQFIVKGSASDGNGAGINTAQDKGLTLYYTKKENPSKPTINTISTDASEAGTKWIKFTSKPTLNQQNISCSFIVPNGVAQAGTNTPIYISVGAVDNSGTGNEGYSEPLKIIIDRANPVISELKIEDTLNTEITTDTWFKNKTLNITGTATDINGSGVTSIKYQVKHDGSNYPSAIASVTSDGTFSINLKDYNSATEKYDKEFADGIYTLKIWAVDEVGNPKESNGTPSTSPAQAKEQIFRVDTTLPVIISGYNGVINSDGISCPIELTVTDENSSGVQSVILEVGENSVSCSLENGKWKADIKDKLSDGTSTVSAVATDKAGNKRTTAIASVKQDTTPPNISILTASATKDTITITGNAEDGTGAGISTEGGLRLYFTKNSTLGASKPIANKIGEDVDSEWVLLDSKTIGSDKSFVQNYTWNDWTITVPTGEDTWAPLNSNTTIYVSVYAKDYSGSGNEGYSTPVAVLIDREKPKIDDNNSGIGDLKGKSVINTRWFSATTLNVFGETETHSSGSGIKAVYYKIKPAGDSSYTQTKSITVENRKYGQNISGFIGGTNELVIWAEDKAGNVSDEIHYTVMVDTTPPDIDYLDTDLYTSGDAELEFSINVSDSVSDLNKDEDTDAVIVNITGIAAPKKAEFNESTSKWSVKIPNSSLPGEDGKTKSYSINVTATNNAGLSNQLKIGNLVVDKCNPTITIANIPDADKSTSDITDVNRTFTISVTASDDNTLSSVSVEYAPLNDNGNLSNNPTWSPLTLEEDPESVNTWNANFDTTILPDNKQYQIRATATDSVGNTVSVSNKVKVNQDSDRPIITTRSITLATKNDSTITAMGREESAVWAKTNELWGEVWDDDGVKELYIMRKTDDSTNPEENDSGWGTKHTGGSWSYTVPTSEEGYGVFFFKVVDDAGKSFISKVGTTSNSTYTPLDVTSLDTPKLVDKDGNKYGYSTGAGATATTNKYETVLYVKVDTNKPTILRDKIYYTLDSAKAGAVTSDNIASYFDGTDVPEGWHKISELLTNDKYIGGSLKKEIWILYASNDSNGIKKRNTDNNGTETINEELSRSGMTIPVYSTPVIEKETKNADKCSRLAKFDVSALASGNYTLSLQVTDQAGARSEKEEFSIQIDNDAPVVEFTSPENESNAYGSLQVEVKGTTNDDKIAEIGAFYYAVTKSDTVPDEAVFTPIRDKFTSPATGKLLALTKWSIVFDGTAEQATAKNQGDDGETKYYVERLNNLITDSAGEEDLYIWGYAKDSLGNSSYSATMTPRKLHVIRYADKPEIEISKPTISETTLGGQITISGTTEIKADKVAKVFIQIDPNYSSTANYNGEHFNPNWYTDENIGSFTYTDNEGQSQKIYNVESISVGTGTNASTMKGILVNGTGNWNYQINSKKEFNSEVNGQKRVVAIRAYAVSTQNQYISDVQERIFTIDPDRPLFSGAQTESDFMLVSKDNPNITKRYSENDWISGEWYLKGSVKHSAGIKALSVSVNDGTPQDLVLNLNDNSANVTGITAEISKRDKTTYPDEYNNTAAANAYNWDFSILIGNSSSGAGGIKLEFNASANVEDKDTATTVNLRYDNNPPSNFVALAGGSNITLSSSTEDSSIFKQSQGTFALSGSYSESGNESGLKRIAFYFTRTVGGKKYFIDPMVTKLDSNEDLPAKYRNNYVEVTTSVEQHDDGLLWVKASGGTINSSSPNTVSVTIPTAYSANIRTGGICKINGIVYRISSVGNDSIELDGNPIGSTGLDVYFALAQIIDNTSTETSKDGVTYSGTYDSSKNDRQELINNGDGDQMLEEINTLESTWQAQINSQNIYDGEVKLTFVYYDKAGNHAKTEYKGEFCNNAPRIAAVTVGSDVSGNDVVDPAEKRTFYVSEVQPEGSSQKYAGNVSAGPVTVGSNSEAFKKLKGVSRIEFEIIGGNGELWYDYAVYNPGTTLNTSNNTYSADPKFEGQSLTSLGEGNQDNSVKSNYTKSVAGETVIGSSDASFDSAHTYGIDLASDDFDNYLGTGTGEGTANTHYIANNDDTNKVTWFKYTIWDETDGKTKFTNSQNVTINLALNVQVHDTINPSILIDNFKWKSKADNSIYGGETENGHIDLSSDLPTGTFNQTSGEMDLDPKVSGKVVFRGTAWDNTNIKELWAKLYYTSGGTTKTHTLSNPYDSTASNTNLSGYTKIAVFEAKGGNGEDKDDMVWKFAKANANAATMAANGWEFSVDKNDDGSYKGSIGEDGHLVYWTFSFDSQQLADVCANDVKLEIRAVDKVNRITAGAVTIPTASYENEAAFRKTANVPATFVAASSVNVPYYQFDVVPYIQKLVTRLDQANIAFTRSAKGNYSVMRGETGVKLYGFNLKGANTTVKFNGTSVGTVTAKPNTDASAGNYVSFTIPTGATSGEIDVTVNGNVSLNNNNSPTAEYNLEPNGLNNDTLNDDRNIYVWSMNNVLDDTVKTIRYPSFKIGKGTGQPYAFVYDYDGRTVHYNLDGSDKLLDTSYSQWYSTGCAVDTDGNIYGGAQNGDSLSNDYANYKFYAFANKTISSGWYTNTSGAYSDYAKLNNGTPYGGSSVKLEWDYDNGDFYAERVKNPKIATSVGTSNTGMYTVYFDSAYNRLVFRYGTAKYNSGRSITFGNSYGIDTRGDEPSAPNAQVIDSSTNVGEYAAVGVIPTGVTGAGTAVVCWNSDNKLMFKYNTDPTTNSWSPAITIDSDYAGEYCDLAVDAAGGIHMAYYRAGNKLKYAYLSSYEDTVADVCMVDSYLSVGENISIETSSKTIEYEGGVRYVPYISYYSSAIGMAKVAWPEKLGTNINSETVSTPNTFVDGVSSDKFTGTWEVQVLPTAINTKLLNYTIGVGEKKAGTKQSVMLGYGTRTGLQTALLY